MRGVGRRRKWGGFRDKHQGAQTRFGLTLKQLHRYISTLSVASVASIYRYGHRVGRRSQRRLTKPAHQQGAPDFGRKSTQKPAKHDVKKKASPAREGFAKTSKPTRKNKNASRVVTSQRRPTSGAAFLLCHG